MANDKKRDIAMQLLDEMRPFVGEGLVDSIVMAPETTEGEIQAKHVLIGLLKKLRPSAKDENGKDKPASAGAKQMAMLRRSLPQRTLSRASSRSLVVMDLALRRRFHFQECPPEPHRIEPKMVGEIDLPKLLQRINDRLGHAAGDAVLCAVAQTLQAHASEVDRVARFGGEEFCVLLPHTLHDGAVLAAERLREAVNQVCIPWGDESIAVTISTGMATAEDPAETLGALMRRADEALYQAKSDGRNRVVAAPRSIAA